MKKHWYDYLWIFSLIYLVLGFVHILFAWIGLICFVLPLLFAIIGGNKGYCNRYCGGASCSGCWAAALACPGKGIFRTG